MFRDNNSDDRYVIITHHTPAVTEEDYENSMRIEWFPSRNKSGMAMSVRYLNENYVRLTEQEEEKWNREYFKDKNAYYAAEEERELNERVERTKAQAKKFESFHKQEALAQEKNIDTTQEKFLVIHSGSCEVFEALLNRAAKRQFKVTFTTQTEQSWFMAVMERK